MNVQVQNGTRVVTDDDGSVWVNGVNIKTLEVSLPVKIYYYVLGLLTIPVVFIIGKLIVM